MNTDFENIPSELFDWLQRLSFEELDARQQQRVLACFSKEEYDSMHAAAMVLHEVSGGRRPERTPSRKALLARFDAQHAEAKVLTLFPSKVLLWQAASAILLILSGGLFYRMIDLKKNGIVQHLATADTVYVDREVRAQPSVIYDTIYLYRQAEARNRQERQADDDTVSVINVPSALTNDIYVLPLEDVDMEKPRGNSMKDDSILQRFGTVSM